MTWRELNAKVEALGLSDLQLGALHVMLEHETERAENEAAIEIFANALGTLSVVNSCCD